MDRKLSAEDALESSLVVANCRMNRERGVLGRNSDAAELGLDPLEFLGERLAGGQRVAWLDLCCGTGKALV
jgi:hypothetical protein